MALDTFDTAKTFVAWVDISGFKQMMQEEGKAQQALSALYSIGFDAIRNQNGPKSERVNGLFVSDAGVLFSRGPLADPAQMLSSILSVIRSICHRMLERDYLMTVSVAFGDFEYREKQEFVGLSKNAIFGGAYLSAYIDSEVTAPRIKPGYCRIVKKGLPDNLVLPSQDDAVLGLVRDAGAKHYDFYWMADNPSKIEEVKEAYEAVETDRWPRLKAALRLGAV